jgi:hypothetical protein
LSGEFFILKWEGGDYRQGEKLARTYRHNLRGAAYGDVMNTGKPALTAMNTDDLIQIIEPPGRVVWSSGEHFGGANVHYVKPKEDPELENIQYLPTRLMVSDIDSDGKNELITTDNEELAGRFLSSFRKFTNSRMKILSWNGLGLVEEWSSEKISGHISDFNTGDFDNDGIDELVASVIMKDGSIIGTSARSVIIAFELK